MITAIIIISAVYNVGLIISAFPFSRFIANHYPDLSRNQRGLMTVYMSLAWPYPVGLGIWKAIKNDVGDVSD